MNLIYSHSYASARTFALHHDFMPGDWKWIQDSNIVRQNPRADVYRVPKWEANPKRQKIDEALEQARRARRLGTVTDADGSPGTLGISGA
ncbi:hypothetical protein [Agrilutibacter solisilvae]|uniref:Uncharacterized protein n=1 Tax=Agrilutibacter solisilvae TaxID=2763317 RepID=A0A975ATD7_9GAMM|nr:hypothetical protein [Lysobacter solisilvae]QSX78895.1 hypothetical protein I8J32_002930 [Lysobacter solisilvae]